MTEELTAVQAGIKLPDDLLVILPTRNVVLFPGVIAPITLGRETTINAVQEAMRTNRRVGLMLQRNPNDDEPDAEDLYEVGTLVNVLRYVTTQEGTHHLVVQGEERFKVQHYLHDAPYLAAKVSLMPDPKSDDLELEARRRYLQGLAIEVAKLLPQLPNDVIQTLQNISDAGALADLIANFMDMTPAEKQQLLEVTDLNERLERVSELLRKQHEVLKITREIDSKAKASMDERQREYMLREQMKAIRKQLGEDDNNSAELEELRSALEETKLPKEVDEHAKKELRRLEQMQDSSGEYSMVRTYLD